MLPSARGWRAPEPAFRGYPDATHIHRRLGGALLDPLSPRQFRTSPMLHRPMGGALRDPVWPLLLPGDASAPAEDFMPAAAARLLAAGLCSFLPGGDCSSLPGIPRRLPRTSCPPPLCVCLRPGCPLSCWVLRNT
ncbi:hypothetical protein CesoFtcFv8_023402 [Champsocephalus esox]|uniref:Uncharacterized protein n=1 Tax=Champsocephalus esox TaxID=159716 RepID=A0AAN8B961_9TELE|nr:hypothetical protein CesoFtcFv8_023402 [Champsocephalus esox]